LRKEAGMGIFDWIRSTHIQPIYSLTGPWGALIAFFIGFGTMNIARVYFGEGKEQHVDLRKWNSFVYGECICIPLYGFFAGMELGDRHITAWYTEVWITLSFLPIGLAAAGINYLLGKKYFQLPEKTWLANTERWHIFGCFPLHALLIVPSFPAMMYGDSDWAKLAVTSLQLWGLSILTDRGKKEAPKI